jgi:hypothetical protein
MHMPSKHHPMSRGAEEANGRMHGLVQHDNVAGMAWCSPGAV